MANILKKSELSCLTGIGGETIRYYEKIGLLDAPSRDSNGYRIFTKHHLKQLNFIKMCRHLGFSIDTIKQIQRLQNGDTPKHADEFIQKQLSAIDQKLSELNTIKQTLMAIELCQNDDKSCKVVDFLQGNTHQ